jgi:beta-carotene 3-hydroxylase
MAITPALQDLGLFLAALVGMEGVAWATHRYLMHGALWCIHRSHHEPRTGWFELNDLFAAYFALPSMALIAAGTPGWWGRAVWPPALWIGLGMTAYGAIYAMFHDGLVHGRFRSPLPLKLMKRLVQAHRLHHAVGTRNGAVSFGFLWAPPIRSLKAQLQAIQGGRPNRSPAPDAAPQPARLAPDLAA